MSEEKKVASLIEKELKRFEKQIENIFQAVESVNLLDIEEVEDRLKGAVSKQNALKTLPVLLAQLEELRNKKLKSEDIKGSKSLSPLDDGSLD